LGPDRLDPPEKRPYDPDAKEALCVLLRKVGGKWCGSEGRFWDALSVDWNDSDPTGEELRRDFFGVARGGERIRRGR